MTASAQGSVPVVVAAHDIAPYQQVQSADLAIQQLPKNAVNQGAARQISQVIGRYTKTAVAQGTQITNAQVTAKDESSLADLLTVSPPNGTGGLVAYALPVDSPILADIKAGNLVQLLVSQQKGTPAVIIGSSVPVLSVVQGNSNSGSSGGALILGVTPQQAQLLASAQNDVQVALLPYNMASAQPTAPQMPNTPSSETKK